MSARGGRCLDADLNTIRTNGTKVQLWSCNGWSNQAWSYYADGTIRSGYNEGKCLDADAGTVNTNGTRIQLWDCNGGPQQRWLLSAVGTATVIRSVANSGKCLDADLNTIGRNGTRVQLWACSGAQNQQWRLSMNAYRAPDGRAGTINAEIEAYYRQGLVRASDSAGFSHFVGYTAADCRGGLMHSGWDILMSAEAQQRWISTDDWIGAVYRSLLNRNPDPGGLSTFRGLAASRGRGLVVTSIMASAEYKGRTKSGICAGRSDKYASGMVEAAALRSTRAAYAGVAGDHIKQCYAAKWAEVATFFSGQLFALANEATAPSVEGIATGIEAKMAQMRGQVCDAARNSLEQVKAISRIERSNGPAYVSQKLTRSGLTCTAWVGIGTDPATFATWTSRYLC